MRTTVLIPLHHASPWEESLREQIAELQDVAHVIISDATGADSTLESLRASFDHPLIEWIGPRALDLGWVAHMNDLQERASTEFVMWLPQDDRVNADWIVEAERKLDSNPDAVAACGAIYPLSYDSDGRGGSISVSDFVGLRSPQERIARAVEHVLLGRTGELGILFRSVVRRDLVPRVPPGISGDEWSDLLWALRLLRVGPIETLDAKYGKRWHDENTHSSWKSYAKNHSAVRRAIASSLSDGDDPRHSKILGSIWSNEVERLSAAIARLEDDVEAERARGAAAILQIRADYENSRSWRLTAPLRLVGSMWSRRDRR